MMKKQSIVSFLAIVGLTMAGAVTTASQESLFADERIAKNDGVVLYLSLAPELVYDDTTSYRGLSATPFPEESLVRTEPSEHPQIAFILATYPPEAVPDLHVVTLGLRYPKGTRVLRYGLTHECLPMATRDWPLSGEGIAIGLLEDSDTSRVAELGWVAFVAREPGGIELTPHPDVRMAGRVVSRRPRYQVPIAAFGTLGIGQPGSAPIPQLPGPELGASCLHDTLCFRLSREEAEYYRSEGRDVVFLGVDVSCGDDPCAHDAPLGACCLADGGCERLTLKSCVERTGRYLGNGTRCNPGACQPPDTTQTSGAPETEER
jgi:hypothetical protein